MFQTKVVEKTKIHLLCSVTFFSFGNRAVYEVVNILRCMLIACLIPKTTNTQYVILTIFPRQQCLHVRWERSCSMRTDGRTDMTKLIVTCRNCGNAPKISPFCPHSVFFLWISEQIHYFSMLYKITGFYNQDGMCLLRGTSLSVSIIQANLSL